MILRLPIFCKGMEINKSESTLAQYQIWRNLFIKLTNQTIDTQILNVFPDNDSSTWTRVLDDKTLEVTISAFEVIKTEEVLENKTDTMFEGINFLRILDQLEVQSM